MSYLALIVLLAWAFGWGWFAHDDPAPLYTVFCIAWPLLLPASHLYHWWVWGTERNRRFVYTDRRWWQRGLKQRRPSKVT